MVLSAGSPGQVELEGDDAAGVGDEQILRRQCRELRLRRRGVHLGLAELGQGAVDLGEQEEPAEGPALVQAGIAHGVLGRGYPGGPLGLLERPPAGGHMAEVIAHGHLGRGARVWQSARRRLSLPAVFVLDDCHLAPEATDNLLERLGPEREG